MAGGRFYTAEGPVFASAYAKNLLDRLDPNLAVSNGAGAGGVADKSNAAVSNGNGAAILETARQRARTVREIREQGSREGARPG